MSFNLRRLLRSLLAVGAGFVLVTVLSLLMDVAVRMAFPRDFVGGGTDHPALLAAALGYTAFFVVLGGYTTAWIASHCPMRHALALGVIGLLLSILATVASWQAEPVWYHFVALADILPAAWLGGTLRERQISPA